MRNYWLTAIAGHQGNVLTNISREGPTGAEGAKKIGRPGCGARGRWVLAGQRANAPIEARGADGSWAAHGAARPHSRAWRPENPRVHKQQPALHSNT